MTREQEEELLLQTEAVLWRRERGLMPSWEDLSRIHRQRKEIEAYWQARDRAAEEKER